MNYGFIRCVCATPDLKVADCNFNSEQIILELKKISEKNASVAVFPELCITGYTCGDLFFQRTLQESAEENLKKIIECTPDNILVFVGLPVPLTEGIYNCAAVIFNKKLLALIPKTYLPNYGEFYERRQFLPFTPGLKTKFLNFAGFSDVPFGTDIIFEDKKNPSVKIAAELCEDLWVPYPPSIRHAISGATIIANLSAGNEVIGKADYRRNLVKMHSAKNLCAYLYANAGHDESTQDMIFSGHNLICENGSLLAESTLFSNQSVYADIDVERLCQERRHTTSFGFSSANFSSENGYTIIKIELTGERESEKKKIETQKLCRYIDPHPFVPSEENARNLRCMEVVTLQAEGLAKRLRHINCKSAVIGLSGGLDSTLALLITAKAFDLCGIERKFISAITMPCFGTTDRTYNNACKLADEIGATLKEIPIAKSVRQHFEDLAHDEKNHDVTYENCQARERTQVLMDWANKTNGIVIGTGDLSELALGWCTYNGDHMSMYGVNSSVPKTLVRYLVQWFADEAQKDDKKDLSAVLNDILATPVSPELLPPEDGNISQVTEDLVGPYELHDFYLYYLLRFGFSPSKILFLAQNSSLPYDRETMIKWMKIFYRRFFSQQFKRSCLPDGAKVGTVNLSPRGDWRMPSDACSTIWLKEIEKLC